MTRHTGLDHREVAHRWANDPEGSDHGRGHNMYFENGVIYSYGRHFAIARHIANDKSERAVLITTRSYSISTASHCSYVRSASHHIQCFHVPFAESCERNHQANMRHYQTQYDGAIMKAGRCSSTGSGPKQHLDQAAQSLTNGNEYAAFFSTNDCVVPAGKFQIAGINSRWARLNSPEAQAKREAEREHRAERSRVRNAKKLQAWLGGEKIILPYDTIAHLRIKYDSIQTSQGASFPIGDAERAFALIAAVRKRGEDWKPNGEKSPQLGSYKIDRIAADGTVRAGCHTVPWSAIERVAGQLGLLAITS